MVISELLATATRKLRSQLTLQVLQGRFLELPAGRIRLEIAFAEDETGGYNSVKVFSENPDKNWDLIEDFHFARGSDADDLYSEILDAIS